MVQSANWHLVGWILPSSVTGSNLSIKNQLVHTEVDGSLEEEDIPIPAGGFQLAVHLCHWFSDIQVVPGFHADAIVAAGVALQKAVFPGVLSQPDAGFGFFKACVELDDLADLAGGEIQRQSGVVLRGARQHHDGFILRLAVGVCLFLIRAETGVNVQTGARGVGCAKEIRQINKAQMVHAHVLMRHKDALHGEGQGFEVGFNGSGDFFRRDGVLRIHHPVKQRIGQSISWRQGDGGDISLQARKQAQRRQGAGSHQEKIPAGEWSHVDIVPERIKGWEYGKIASMNHKWAGVILCLTGVFFLFGAILPGKLEEHNLEIPLAQAIEKGTADTISQLPEELLSTCSVQLQTRWRGVTLAGKTEAITQRIQLDCARPPEGVDFSIRARIDEPARLILPDNDNIKPLVPGSPLILSWALHPGDMHLWEGTLWTYLTILSEGDESVEMVLSSIQLGGKTTRLLGLNYPQMIAAGIALVVGGLLIFLWIWRFLRKKHV